MAIKPFRCKDTEAMFGGPRIARFAHIGKVAMRKLAILNRVVSVDELQIPPKNRLEALKGDCAGQFSIRVNDQWRICSRFADGDTSDVEFVNYH